MHAALAPLVPCSEARPAGHAEQFRAPSTSENVPPGQRYGSLVALTKANPLSTVKQKAEPRVAA